MKKFYAGLLIFAILGAIPLGIHYYFMQSYDTIVEVKSVSEDMIATTDKGDFKICERVQDGTKYIVRIRKCKIVKILE